MKNIKVFLIVLAVLLVGFVVVRSAVSSKARQVPSPVEGQQVAGKYDEFATCLKEKGSVFYGAFWCPHCNNTKALFGTSEKLLPYVECSTPDGGGQLQVCKDKKIMGYPTWEFADSSRLTGEVALETLAEKTSCVLPK